LAFFLLLLVLVLLLLLLSIIIINLFDVEYLRQTRVLVTGALKMTDRKMTDRDIAGGGKCRTGIRRTKV